MGRHAAPAHDLYQSSQVQSFERSNTGGLGEGFSVDHRGVPESFGQLGFACREGADACRLSGRIMVWSTF